MSHQFAAAPISESAEARIPLLLTAPGLALVALAAIGAAAALLAALGPTLGAMTADAPFAAAAAAAIMLFGAARTGLSLYFYRRDALSVASAGDALRRAASRWRKTGQAPIAPDPDGPIAARRPLWRLRGVDLSWPRLAPKLRDLAACGGDGVKAARRRCAARATTARRFWGRMVGAAAGVGVFALALGAYQALTAFGRAGSTAMSHVAAAAEPLSASIAGQSNALILDPANISALASAASALSLADGLGGLILCVLAAVALLGFAAAETAAARALSGALGALERRDNAFAAQLAGGAAAGSAQETLRQLAEGQSALAASHATLLDCVAGWGGPRFDPWVEPASGWAEPTPRSAEDRRQQSLDFIGAERRAGERRSDDDGAETESDTRWMIEMSVPGPRRSSDGA